jgi:hypothetical protein
MRPFLWGTKNTNIEANWNLKCIFCFTDGTVVLGQIKFGVVKDNGHT